jgi:hypothetical protein
MSTTTRPFDFTFFRSSLSKLNSEINAEKEREVVLTRNANYGDFEHVASQPQCFVITGKGKQIVSSIVAVKGSAPISFAEELSALNVQDDEYLFAGRGRGFTVCCVISSYDVTKVISGVSRSKLDNYCLGFVEPGNFSTPVVRGFRYHGPVDNGSVIKLLSFGREAIKIETLSKKLEHIMNNARPHLKSRHPNLKFEEALKLYK